MAQGKALASSRHNKMDTNVNSQRLWQGPHRLKPDKIPALRRPADNLTPPQQLFVMDTCYRRETSVSLLGCYCACQPHFRTGSVPRSRWPTQNRFCFYMCASWLFIGFGFLVCFLLADFHFLFFVVFFLFLFLWVRKKEHEIGWIER